jgi:hypothetical protein
MAFPIICIYTFSEARQKPANEPLVRDGRFPRFRFAERSLLGRRLITPFGRGGRLSYSDAPCAAAELQGVSAEANK